MPITMDTMCIRCCETALPRRGGTPSVSAVLFFLLILVLQSHTSLGQRTVCQSSKQPYTTIFVNNIAENWPVGTVLSQLDITGSDSEISLSLYPNDYVSLNQQSRELTLRKKLNRELMDSINFRIECTILSRSQSIDIEGKVLIVDINNNPPIFEKQQYAANISEMAPIGTTVMSGMKATDADVDNWYITYEVVEGPYSAFFNIPIPSKGDLLLRKQLDYELTQQMEVIIMAKDNHNPDLSVAQPVLNSTTTLIINIYDGDDQNPAFRDAPYLAMVEENSPIGTVLDVQPKIFAFDQDFGINASVEYSLVPDTVNGEDEYFLLDPKYARLELKKDALRRGTKFSILVKVTETSNSDRYATTSVRVWVQAANESPPKFVDKVYTATLAENTPVGSLVTTVSAIDNDEVDSEILTERTDNGVSVSEGAVLSYSFGANPVPEFAIDHRLGHVTTTEPLNYERVKQYNLSVVVSDGQNTDVALVQVNIININDHNPSFTQQLYVFEGIKKQGSKIGQLDAIDEDADSFLSYRFVENSTLFLINEAAEIIMVGDSDDIEMPEYRLFVVAEDSGAPPRQTAAAVLVTYEGIKGPVSGTSQDGGEAGQTNLIIIIVLGVIAGMLIIIIVILCIYIYRKEKGLSCSATCDCCYDLAESESTEGGPVTLLNVWGRLGSLRRSRAEMTVSPESSQSDSPMLERQSFEKGLTMDKEDYKTYMDITDPEGLAYTPAKERHLQMYNDVSLDGDSTTTQENPFNVENGYARTNGVGRSAAGHGYIHVHQNSSHGSLPQPSSSQYSSNVERNNGINEIEYATAITPMDRSIDQQGSESTLCADSSIASSTQSVLDMSTFRAGSTQRLVSNPKGSQSSRKGSSNVSSVNMKNKGSSVSFIDNHQNAIDPLVMPREERPGITVYY